jgi:predicted nucleic acid-binding protein
LKNSYVFDTGPLYLHFADDKRVKELFREVGAGAVAGYTAEPNLAELYYKTCETLGRDAALLRYTSIRRGEMVVVSPDENLTRNAGELKCAHRAQLSLADAYIIAVAKKIGGTLYTTDPRVAKLKIVPTHLIELSD